MSVTAIFEYCESIDNCLMLEYFYKGEKIEDPALFFDLHPGLFEFTFPSLEETKKMIHQHLLNSTTHKLVVSEYGFHEIRL